MHHWRDFFGRAGLDGGGADLFRYDRHVSLFWGRCISGTAFYRLGGFSCLSLRGNPAVMTQEL